MRTNVDLFDSVIWPDQGQQQSRISTLVWSLPPPSPFVDPGLTFTVLIGGQPEAWVAVTPVTSISVLTSSIVTQTRLGTTLINVYSKQCSNSQIQQCQIICRVTWSLSRVLFVLLTIGTVKFAKNEISILDEHFWFHINVIYYIQ